MTYKQISFYFFRGEEFPNMDNISVKNIGTKFGGKKKKLCDGFIKVKYMGIMRKTESVAMDNNDQNRIKWNQIIDIPETQPTVSQKILLVVKDDDGLNGKIFDIVGSFELKLSDIFPGKYDNYTYLDNKEVQ